MPSDREGLPPGRPCRLWPSPPADRRAEKAQGRVKRGEHKSLQTDRVILVPGPTEEVQNVRWIYKAFVEDGLNETDIAARLNQAAF